MDKALFSYRADVPIGATPDGKQVYASRAFLDYIAVQLFSRVGGNVAMTNLELESAIGAASIAPVVDNSALLYALDEFRQAPMPAEHVPQMPEPDGLISALQAQVAVLQQQINDLQLGKM